MSRFTSSLLASVAPILLLTAGLLAYSAIQAPVPGVNEPQYLGKAKHFWDAAWCPADFFLRSSNPHLVFYAAVGGLTRLVSLEATAWIGRLAGYTLLAIGWCQLARRLVGSNWAALPSAAIFLLLASCGSLARSSYAPLSALSAFGSLSGEWLVGGIEGKVFAYAILFAALAFWLDRRANLAALCLGLATSFRPVIGAWAVVCGAFAELAPLLVARITRLPSPPHTLSPSHLVAPAAIFAFAALPGVLPALATLGGADATSSARATYMQVFIRLRHHLDPTQFPLTRFAGSALLLAATLALIARRAGSASSPTHDDEPAVRRAWVRFTSFLLAACGIALVGVILGWHSGDAWTMPLRDLRATLLKFYPFRLADLFIPLAFSLALTRHLLPLSLGSGARGEGFPSTPVAHPSRLSTLLSPLTLAAALAIPSPDRNPSRMTPAQFADWKGAAAWIRTHTPADAEIVSPHRQWGFRWFAQRAVFVDYKDAPQETAGILEWERRIGALNAWWSSTPGTYSTADLARLGADTGANYLVTSADPSRFLAEPLYVNDTYRIYSLAP